MVPIKFFLLDIDYKNSIRIFGRTPEGKRICVLDPMFKPYFLVTPSNSNKESLEEIQKKISGIREENHFVLATSIIDKKIFGDPVKAIKVTVNIPEAVNVIADIITEGISDIEIKENDIPFLKRYCIDKQITPLTLYEVKGEPKKTELRVDFIVDGEVKSVSPEILDLKALAFSIKTDKSLKGEDKDAIVSIAFNSKNLKKVITWKKTLLKNPKDYILEIVSDEHELIHKSIELINEYDCDCLIGYDSDEFDLPYLEIRARKYNFSVDLALDRSRIRLTPGKNAIKIKGLNHLDISQFIRKIMAGSLQLESYDLETIAREVLKKDIKLSVSSLL
jgi:DNA polymerase I